jgi:uncharacterized protein (TIGR03437 family)
MNCVAWMLSCSVLAAALQADAPTRDLLGKLPLRFEASGDVQSGATYVARGRNFNLRLSPEGNWLEWSGATNSQPARIRTRLIGTNPRVRMQAEDPLPGSVNYFLGSPENWRTDVAGFGRVRYHEVYAGIDLVFHGGKGALEYDFVLAPHADPRKIRMDLSGEDSLRIDTNGDLVVAAGASEIRWKRPEIYQERDGTRAPVAGRFVLAAHSMVRFEIGRYDRSRTLVIDPTLSYLTYLGASGDDMGRGIGLDGSGNVYIAGTTFSDDLDTISAFQPNFGGRTASPMGGDGFLAKFSPSGTLLYLTYLGGSRDDAIYGLAVDSAGDAYVTGSTDSLDFPTVNPFQAQFGGLGNSGIHFTGDAFVAKLNPTGNKLLYSTYLGGSQDDIGMAITIDSGGDAYVTGATQSTNFPTTPAGGEFQPHMNGVGGEPIRPCCNVPLWDTGDAFVAKLDPTGSVLLFSTYLGGLLDDIGVAIAIDSSSNVYVGGCTLSFNFPTSPGALDRQYGGTDPQNEFQNSGDGFVTKLNPTGSALIFSTFIGGSGDDCVTGLAVDSSGNVYMAGTTSTQNLPTTPGAFQPAFAGYKVLPFDVEQDFGDAFVAKLNPAGSAFIYLSYLGGSLNDVGGAIAVDSGGNAYVTGFTGSPDFPTAGGPLQPAIGGAGPRDQFWEPMGDAFLSVVNPTGTVLLYSSYFGGTQDETGIAMALDGAGNLYITGGTRSPNLPVTSNAWQPKLASPKTDVFYAVFSGFSATPPTIATVKNAFGGSTTIAPNTWVAITGTNLAPDTRIWQASDFVNNQLPTSLDGASVLMNGTKAYIYYISGTQINALTPPNLAPGPVQVEVVNGSFTSSPVTVQAQATSPSLFVFDAAGHVVGQHLSGYPGCPPMCDIGPTTLYPGLTEPASPGEEVVLYGNGFGSTSVPVVAGSETQSGTLPGTVTVSIAGQNAQVLFSGLVAPGLYQFNVVLPSQLPTGDVSIGLSFNGQATPSPTVITIQ